MAADGKFVTFILQKLETKPNTTIAVFENGEFYSCYGSDAVFAAKQCFRSDTFLKRQALDGRESPSQKQQHLLYLTCNKNQFEFLIRELLLVHKYRLELFGKCKSAGRSHTAESCGFRLVSEASPGNLADVEDIIFGKETGAATFEQVRVVALLATAACEGSVRGARNVAIASCDTTRNEFQVCEFVETSENFSVTESTLIQLGPKECLVMPACDSGIREVLDRLKIPVTELKKGRWSKESLITDLNRLIKFPKGAQVNANALPETQLASAMSCVSALVSYLGLLSGELMENCYHLRTFSNSGFMRLDSGAFESLSVFPEKQSGKDYSLFGVLNRCRTKMGQRLLMQWLKQPLMDVNLINDRLDVVECLLQNLEMLDALHGDALARIPDLARVARKLGRKKAGLQDCYVLYQVVQRLEKFFQTFEDLKRSCECEKKGSVLEAYLSAPLTTALREFAKYAQLIEKILDFSKLARREYMIRPDFDEDLGRIREMLDDLESQIEAIGQRAARNLGLEFGKSIKMEMSNQHGQLLRVTKRDEKHFRGNKAYTIVDSQRGGVRFVNAELRDVNVKYLAEKQNYDKAQAAIVKDVMGVVQTYLDPLHRLTDFLAYVDVVCSLATCAKEATIPYTRPVLHGIGEEGHTAVLRLRDARHPCIEAQGSVSFIPNDIHLGGDGGPVLTVVSGPNMGGKSTYIRQVALVTLMAQIGSFVPCSEGAEISCRDAIFTRIGASDSALKGLSTFMSEMLETSNILKTATQHSLIIIDELGRGTSTFDGFGLAWSVAEWISTNIGGFCLFATHFHELAGLADVHPGRIINEHLTAIYEEKQLTLLYKVQPGPCTQSFGISIAQMTGMPGKVVQEASALAEDMEGLSYVDCKAFGSEDVMRQVLGAFMQSVQKSLVEAESDDAKLQESVKDLVKHMKQDYDI